MPDWKKSLLFLLSFALYGSAFLHPDFLSSWYKSSQEEKFQEAFISQAEELNQRMETWLSGDLDSGFRANIFPRTDRRYYQSFYLYKDQKLIRWTDALAAFDRRQLNSEQQIVQLGNAWYYKVKKSKGNLDLFGLLLIQHNFVHENEFLQNDFQPFLEFEGINKISFNPLASEGIKGPANQVLFYLKKSPKTAYPQKLNYIQGALSIIGLFLFFFLLAKSAPIWLSILFIFLVRLLLWLALPDSWAKLELFSPNWYAISQISLSLGDFILHSLGLFYLAYLLAQLRIWKNIRIIYLAALLLLIASLSLLDIIQMSVQNSSISFNLNNLFDLNYLSILCFAGFALLLLSIILLLQKLAQSEANPIKLVGIFFMGALLILFLELFPGLGWYFHFWILAAYLLLLAIERSQKSTAGVMLLLLLLSSLTAVVVNSSAEKRESQKREILIQKLAEEKDPIAEYLFSQFSAELSRDSIVLQLLDEDPFTLESYLKKKYFSGYWKKYKFIFTPCTAGDSLLINPGNIQVSCRNYYLDRIHFETESMRTNNLYQLRNLAGRIDYIAHVELQGANDSGDLFIEMSANFFNQNEGYPELLIDEKSRPENLDLSDYSYAVYDNSKLIMKSGDFNYSTLSKFPELSENTFYKYQSENHEHLVFQKDSYTSIVLSKRLIGNYEFFTSLAYLLVIFCALYLIISLLFSHFPHRFRLQFNDFSSRIQFFLVSSLLLALLLFSVGTTYYIKKQNQEKNFKNIAEKIRSVNIEMENKIGGESVLADSINNYISTLLVRFSNVFYTDINLYDTTGILYASSRPEIYAKGLKGNRLNPSAYRGLIQDNKAEWLQKEQIGEMEYLSAYVPFKNDDNKVLAYLNLPYFAKHNELQKEISSFLVSTINIYVGIFVLALLVSVLLINQLAKPLLMIRKQLASIKLGAKLELIEWNSDDEIGSLVKEYNRMIVELSESADRLAQSEREGAWREMAKQVAHEIKNPLTPMKLSIQHLQMAYEQGADGLDEKVRRTTQTLVEQIETLSNIATEFSAFAKMPVQNLSRTNLTLALKSAVDLYAFKKGEKIKFNDLAKEAWVMADRDQLIRLFNNLIKNSLQAASPQRELKIEIELEEIGEGYNVYIRDNGVGIMPEQVQRIFEPNFTTKTGGTGLGLAMAKNIIENLGGAISLESSPNEGTTFKLYFPKAQQLD